MIIDKPHELPACPAGKGHGGSGDEHLVSQPSECHGSHTAFPVVPFFYIRLLFGSALVDAEEEIGIVLAELLEAHARCTLHPFVRQPLADGLGGEVLQVGNAMVVWDARLLLDLLPPCVAAEQAWLLRDVRVLECQSRNACADDALCVVVLWVVAADALLVVLHWHGEPLLQWPSVVLNHTSVGVVHPVNEQALIVAVPLHEGVDVLACRRALRFSARNRQELVEVKERHPCVLHTKSVVAVVVSLPLRVLLFRSPKDDGHFAVGNIIAQHVGKMLLAIVGVVVEIEVVEAKRDVVLHELAGILVLHAAYGAQGYAVLLFHIHNSLLSLSHWSASLSFHEP